MLSLQERISQSVAAKEAVGYAVLRHFEGYP